METKTRSTETEIFDEETRLISAFKASDLNTLDSLLHEDLLFVTPDGKTITKKMDLDAHKSGTMTVDLFIANSEAINVIGDTAVSVSTVETKVKMLNEPIAGFFKYIRVWKCFSGNWKVIGGSCTKL